MRSIWPQSRSRRNTSANHLNNFCVHIDRCGGVGRGGPVREGGASLNVFIQFYDVIYFFIRTHPHIGYNLMHILYCKCIPGVRDVEPRGRLHAADVLRDVEAVEGLAGELLMWGRACMCVCMYVCGSQKNRII